MGTVVASVVAEFSCHWRLIEEQRMKEQRTDLGPWGTLLLTEKTG